MSLQFAHRSPQYSDYEIGFFFVINVFSLIFEENLTDTRLSLKEAFLVYQHP